MSFLGITDFWAYLLGVVAVIILPGPNSMYCLYTAGARGVLDGYKVAIAIFFGDLILMILAVLGGAAILKTSPIVFLIFKVLGGLYLAYLGVNLLYGAYKILRKGKKNDPFELNEAKDKDTINQSVVLKVDKGKANITKDENVFLKAFVVSLSNPKAILFFLSFFLQFVDSNYKNPTLSFAILGLTLQVVSMIYLSILIFFGTKLADFFSEKHMLTSAGNASVGLLFIGFSLSLWFSRL